MKQRQIHRKLLLLVLLATLVFTSTSALLKAQTNPYFSNTREDGSKESVEEFMAANKVTGLSLAVYTGLELDTAIQLGLRDKESSAVVDENTRFNAGAMSASCYNFLALKAASQGKIDLDAPVLNYMTSWKFPTKGWMKKDPVTTRDLLLGKRRFNVGYKSEGQEPGGKVHTLMEILDGKGEGDALKISGRRGNVENHSYGGHLILRSMLEDVYQKPIEQIIAEEIFEPLGMTYSIFTPAIQADQANNISMGYRQSGEEIEGGHYDYPIMCSGGLWTTPRDYARFVSAIFRAAKGEDNSMLTQELAIQATTPQIESRCLIFNKSYDLFWGGASQGFYTTFAGKPENGTIVVVFTNSDINWKFANRVAGMGWEYSRRDFD